MDGRYRAFALGLCPPGSSGQSVVDLRLRIAEAIEQAVTAAVDAYRISQMPEELRRLKQRLADFETERQQFKLVVSGHLSLLTAVEKWLEYCDGKGEHDDRDQLWLALRTAWGQYRTAAGTADEAAIP